MFIGKYQNAIFNKSNKISNAIPGIPPKITINMLQMLMVMLMNGKKFNITSAANPIKLLIASHTIDFPNFNATIINRITMTAVNIGPKIINSAIIFPPNVLGDSGLD